MNKIANLFNNINNVNLDCEAVNNTLRTMYDHYEQLLTYLDEDSDDGQHIINQMSQIRDAIDALDLTMRSLNNAINHANRAQWAIDGNTYIEGWDS